MSFNHLETDPVRCTGCNSCVLTCAQVHEGAFSLAMSRIRIDADPVACDYTPRVCVQCNEAPCIASCSTNALSRNPETGAILLDASTCIGCRSCVGACPYGGVHFDEASEKPLICDLCGGNPQCVTVCRLPEAVRWVRREA